MTGPTLAPSAGSTQPDARWLNRAVFGMGLTSLLGDAGYEMATAALPGFLAVLGITPAALGAIEGVADSLSSFAKLATGWFSDRLGRRKPLVVGGYLLTGVTTGLFALAQGWGLVLAARAAGWIGRGVRGPLRDAMLASAVPAQARGKAFGFHRAGDTIGAILGPLVAAGFLAYFPPHASNPSTPFRIVFLLTLVPGVGSAIAFAALVAEGGAAAKRAEFWETLKNLPQSFRRFLWGAGLFGLGDFAHTLMILAATQLLAPRYGLARAASVAALLYVVHNVFYAGSAYPVGALSDLLAQASRWGRRGLLAAGYGVGALTALGFALAFVQKAPSLPLLSLLFVLAGVSIAFVDALEGAMTADLVEDARRGTAYGLLGAVNGVGDLVASVMVGSLWAAASPGLAFSAAAGLMTLGAIVLASAR